MSATVLLRSPAPAAGKPAKTTFVLDYSVPFSSSSHPESSSPSSSSSSSSFDDDFLFDDDASSTSPPDNDDDDDELDSRGGGGDADHTVLAREGSARALPRSPQSSPYAMSLALSHRAATLPVASASASASTTSRSPQQPAADLVYSDFLSRQTRNRERRISNQMRSTRTTSQQPPRLAKKADENDGDVLDLDLDSYGPKQASASLSPSTMLQSTADMPFSPEVLSWKLERFLRLSRQASPPHPRTIATRHSPAADLDVLSSATLARLADPSNGKVDEKNEKALKLAGWTKRGRAGVWEAPDDATTSLQALVASINS